MTNDPLTFSDVSDSFIPKAAHYVSRRYSRYGVTKDDIYQEIYVWLLAEGTARVRRWLASDPQQSMRIWRSLIDAGRTYAEREKAHRVGYEQADVFWYSPGIVEAAMPLVLDTTFDGQVNQKDDTGVKHRKAPNEGGDLIATIVDIRRAIKICPDWVGLTLVGSEPGGAGWDDAVRTVVAVLGSEAPTVGRRRVMSNAAAAHLTHAQEAE